MFCLHPHKLDLLKSSIKDVVVAVVKAVDQEETSSPTFTKDVIALQCVEFAFFEFARELVPTVPVHIGPSVAHFVVFLIPDRPHHFFRQQFSPDENLHFDWALHDL